jgi:hypothetical protein
VAHPKCGRRCLGAFFLTRQHAEQLAAIDFNAMHFLGEFFAQPNTSKIDAFIQNFQQEMFYNDDFISALLFG